MTFYDFILKDGKGNDISMEVYRDKVLLVVNTATQCGLTPQYEMLENMYKKYGDQGFEIIDFPCNQFLGQAPGSDDEIASFCTLNYGTTFSRFAKIDVNGENAAPLYTWLKEQAGAERENEESKNFVSKIKELGQEVIGNDIKWNFTKFLIDQHGTVVARFSPTCVQQDMGKEIEDLLWMPSKEMVCSPEFPKGCM